MKKIIGFILLLGVGGWLTVGILRSQETEEVLSIADIQKMEGVPVQVAEVTRRDVSVTREYFGTIEATRKATVTSRLMERMLDVRVEEGDRVTAGTVLAVFDTSASQAQVTQARLAFLNAERDLDRMRSLLAAGAISQQQFDQAELGYDIAREAYQTARRMVFLEAPIAGTVTRVDLREGDLANPGDPVVTIQADRGHEVEFEITQEDRPSLATGQGVSVTLGNGLTARGTIQRISLGAAEQTRTFTVRASVDTDMQLYPGTLAEVRVVVQQIENAVTVPSDALLERNGEVVVFVVDGDEASLRAVDIGLNGEDHVAITGGLSPGERVAVYGHANLVDGGKVKVVES